MTKRKADEVLSAKPKEVHDDGNDGGNDEGGNDQSEKSQRKRIIDPSPSCGLEMNDNHEEVGKNEYSGYSLEQNPTKIERIAASMTSPEHFFDQFISKRKPCIIEGWNYSPSTQKNESCLSSKEEEKSSSSLSPTLLFDVHDLVKVAGDKVRTNRYGTIVSPKTITAYFVMLSSSY